MSADTRSKAAGQRYSDAELCAFLRDLDAELDHRPRKTDADARDGPSSSTIRARFGSWFDGLDAAGIEFERPGSNRDTLDEGQGILLRSNRDAALSLRDAPEPFLFVEVEFDFEMLQRFKAAGIVSHADTRRVPNPHVDSDSMCWAWTVADGVRQWIDDTFGPTGECPREGCEATGVSNLGDGRYTCSNEGCSSHFDRATAREVLG